MIIDDNDMATLCQNTEQGDGVGALDENTDDAGAAVGAPEENNTDCEDTAEILAEKNDREEYERLIRERFKDYFAADAQKLINRRFKKYKALEEKVRRLEEEASRYADIEGLIASEREHAVSETEERMNRRFKAMMNRAEENALMPILPHSSFDVTRLTKDERALLASRAQRGEKIHL